MLETAAFYILSALLVGFAFKVVTTEYVLRAAIYLICSLLSVSGLYLLLAAEFPAAVQIMVYVGGVVVVTIFAILLVSKLGAPKHAIAAQDKAAVMTSVFGLALGAYVTMAKAPLNAAARGLNISSDSSSADQIGRALLSIEQDGFILPFEIISLLLLAAVIGAIVIARTKPESTD